MLFYRYIIDRNDSKGEILKMLYSGIPNARVVCIRHRNLGRDWHAILFTEDNPLPNTHSISWHLRDSPLFIAYFKRLPIINLLTNCYIENIFKFPNRNVLRALGEDVNIWTYGLRGEIERVNLTGEILLWDQTVPIRGRIRVVSPAYFYYTIAALA